MEWSPAEKKSTAKLPTFTVMLIHHVHHIKALKLKFSLIDSLLFCQKKERKSHIFIASSTNCVVNGLFLFFKEMCFYFAGFCNTKKWDLLQYLRLYSAGLTFALIYNQMLCNDFILEASVSHKTQSINHCMTDQEQQKAKAHSNTLISLPLALQVRIMPWKQTIRQWQTWGLRSLGQSQTGCQNSTAGWPRLCRWFHWLGPHSKAR